MSKVKVSYNDKKLRQRVKNFDSDLRRAVGMVVDRQAQEATGWMRTNARWTDRTGAARSGLQGIPIHARTYEEILLTYSVNYGIWLEIAHDRKYAILAPAMRVMGDELMRNLSHILDRMNHT